MRTIVPDSSNNRLNQMEAALLQSIAAFYEHPALVAQINQCQVALREYSRCGFFTTLAVSHDSPPIVGLDSNLNGSDMEATGLSHGAGSILFIRNGRLDFLEVFAYVEGDPTTVSDFVLKPITAGAS